MTAQNIQFRGIRRSPSDITGQDGDLLDCVNLVHEDGELKPIAMPERSNIRVPVRYNEPYTLVHIHNTTDGDMFVFVLKHNLENWMYIQDANNANMLSARDVKEDIRWVSSVGNTLVVGTDKSIHYVLYKNGAYKWLGDSLPRPVIDFMLEYGEVMVQKDPTPSTLYKNTHNMSDGMNLAVRDTAGITDNSFPSVDGWGYHDNSNNESSNNVRDNIKSKISKIVSRAKEENQFIHPFFVRYALRLYDGSYIFQSQPILMLPSTYNSPFYITVNAWNQGGGIVSHEQGWCNIVCNIYAYGLPSRLRYFIKKFVDKNNEFLNNVDDWEDIIKGVDIFCSSQISQVDEAEMDKTGAFRGPFKGYKYPGNYGLGDPGFWPIAGTGNDWMGFLYPYGTKDNLFDAIDGRIYMHGLEPGGRLCWLPLPSLKNEDLIDKVAKTNLFYLAKSYKLNQYNNLVDGNGVYYDEEVETNVLGSLESAKTLPDDYISRGRIKAEIGHTYNKRLILGNINAELPNWYPILEQGGNGTQLNLQLYFEIEKNGKTIYVEAAQNKVSYYRFGHYIYYPDPDCKRVIVYTTPPVGGHNLYTIEMQEHENLNGAYAIMDDLVSLGEAMDNGDFENASERPTASSDRYYPMRNAIAMTEVANPFSLQAANFKDVGNGNVIDLAPNMMEVSSGQWGQYPLYVFSTDGIYAFGINNDGTLGAMSPVSSDVLLTPQGMGKPSLIQANQMLVFITSRGVIGLQGTQARPLSLVMDGRHFNAKDDLGLDVLYDSGAFKSIVNEAYDTKPFHDFVLNSFLAYDYAHNRVLVLNDDRKYQYVLSLDSGLWSRQVTYRNLNIIQTNSSSAQQSSSRGSRSSSGRTLKTIDVTKISAAANNYTEMYLQGNDNRLYVTQNVTEENNNPLYQYGYFVSRPVRFGTDEFKTITRLLHRYTHYAPNSDVKLVMYGSRDGVNYGRINTLRGMSWKYYIFVVYTYLKPNERYSYMTVDFEPRLTNKLR